MSLYHYIGRILCFSVNYFLVPGCQCVVPWYSYGIVPAAGLTVALYILDTHTSIAVCNVSLGNVGIVLLCQWQDFKFCVRNVYDEHLIQL